MDSNSSPTLGIDIGGANLKYANTNGDSLAVEFQLWLRPDELAKQIAGDLAKFPQTDRVVATMTGELADCFLDRRVGVCHIVEHLEQATKHQGLREPLFYDVDGRFLSSAQAIENVDSVAAANWHALASFVARDFAIQIGDSALLVDIGSTTTDLIPLRNQGVATTSRTDYQRLAEGSLVYLGASRTAVCALVNHLVHDGQTVPAIREVFATMDDVRLLLGYQDQSLSDHGTADGNPRDIFHASNRMARMIGLDHRSVSIESARELAGQVHAQASRLIHNSIKQLEVGKTVIISGHANDLVVPLADEFDIILLSSLLDASLSRCAPAYAVAKLLD